MALTASVPVLVTGLLATLKATGIDNPTLVTALFKYGLSIAAVSDILSLVLIRLLNEVVSIIAWLDNIPLAFATTIRVPLPTRFDTITSPPAFKITLGGAKAMFDSLKFKSLLKLLISHNLLEEDVF